MNILPLHDALDTVRHLKRALLEQQRFKGWSGPARILSGTVAIAMAFLLDRQWIESSHYAHILAWGAVFGTAMFLNLGSLIYWFWRDPLIKRNVRRLGPLLDVMPPLFVGAVFTLVLMLGRDFDPLMGVWMCMFGLTNLASRYVLPGAIGIVGVFYILAGALCLLNPNLTFLNPWPMGVVFFAGEWAGGLILYADQRRYAAFERLWQDPPTGENPMIDLDKPHWNDLEKKFHEPARLALVTALCERPGGLGFQDLKQRCGMTDGNLSRHLKVLEEGNIVRMHRAGRGRKAHTQVILSPGGREEFHLYLQALERVLHGALKNSATGNAPLGAFATAS